MTKMRKGFRQPGAFAQLPAGMGRFRELGLWNLLPRRYAELTVQGALVTGRIGDPMLGAFSHRHDQNVGRGANPSGATGTLKLNGYSRKSQRQNLPVPLLP